MMDRLYTKLFSEIDASSIAIFRVGFGLVMLLDCIRYGFVLCLECFYIEPDFMFKFYGFGWVHPLPGDGMYWLFALLALACAGIMLGWFYRFCTIFFAIGFTYVFLLDQARYLNHFYMVILFAILLCFIPAHRHWSVDAWRKPSMSSPTIPYWCKLILLIQLEVILIYAGLVKINPDWLNLEPLRVWLSDSADFPFFGQFFVQDWSIAVAAYGVIALHLVGAPLLFFKQTRLPVFCVYGAFHTLNHFVFVIGVFPWLTWFASLLFFEPDWPKQLYHRACNTMPFLNRNWPQMMFTSPLPTGIDFGARHLVVVLLLFAWCATQIIVPMRHWVYPGDVAWNEEGHRFSWRMKLRTKKGVAKFIVQNTEGESWIVKPREHLSERQYRKMSCVPDMILQYAHYLEGQWFELGHEDVKVFADIKCSLNTRPKVRLVDFTADLTKVERNLAHADWILPLNEPLPNPFLARVADRLL